MNVETYILFIYLFFYWLIDWLIWLIVWFIRSLTHSFIHPLLNFFLNHIWGYIIFYDWNFSHVRPCIQRPPVYNDHFWGNQAWSLCTGLTVVEICTEEHTCQDTKCTFKCIFQQPVTVEWLLLFLKYIACGWWIAL